MTKRPPSGIGYCIAAFVLSGVSNVVELRGDIAPLAASGVSGERLFYHLLALLVLIGALACFVRAGILAYRRITGGVPKTSNELARVFADEEEAGFDADATLARYLARRHERPSDVQPEPPRPHGGFGRKGA